MWSTLVKKVQRSLANRISIFFCLSCTIFKAFCGIVHSYFFYLEFTVHHNISTSMNKPVALQHNVHKSVKRKHNIIISSDESDADNGKGRTLELTQRHCGILIFDNFI